MLWFTVSLFVLYVSPKTNKMAITIHEDDRLYFFGWIGIWTSCCQHEFVIFHGGGVRDWPLIIRGGVVPISPNDPLSRRPSDYHWIGLQQYIYTSIGGRTYFLYSLTPSLPPLMIVIIILVWRIIQLVTVGIVSYDIYHHFLKNPSLPIMIEIIISINDDNDGWPLGATIKQEMLCIWRSGISKILIFIQMNCLALKVAKNSCHTIFLFYSITIYFLSSLICGHCKLYFTSAV